MHSIPQFVCNVTGKSISLVQYIPCSVGGTDSFFHSTLNLDPPKMDPPELIFQKYMDPLELIFQ